MRKPSLSFLTAALSVALLLGPLAAQAPLPAFLEVPPSVRPGEALIVLLSSERSLSSGILRAQRRAGGWEGSTAGLAVSVEEKGQGLEGLLFLLPLPMELLPGELSLVLEWAEGGRKMGRAASSLILKREWISEDISLTSALTQIRASPDPRKTEESDRLAAILASRRPLFCAIDGAFAPPLKERYRTSFFGDRRRYLYSNGSSASTIHWGIDLREETGHPVLASAAGEVVLACERVVTGWTVAVRHADGLFSLYYHLDSLSVTEGESVAKGRELGKLGATGLATGPHLHWEFRLNGQAVDPDGLTGARVLDKIRPAGTIQAPFQHEGG